VGKVTGEFDGENLTLEFAWFSFLGDMNVVFVLMSRIPFAPDGGRVRPHPPSPDQAVERAIANIKRVYGEPSLVPWDHGLTPAAGRLARSEQQLSPRSRLLARYPEADPEGLVVPCRIAAASLLPRSPIQTGVAALAARHRLSPPNQREAGRLLRLYFFKDDRWTVSRPGGA